MKNTLRFFKKITPMLALATMMMAPNWGWGQTSIVSDGLNNSTTLFTLSGGTFYTGNSVTGDRPATSPFAVEGTYSYGVTNGTATLTSNNINTTGYTSIILTVRDAAFSIGSTGNGMDNGDYIRIEISPNGGANFYNTIELNGNGNAYWPFTATGIASTAYDGNSSTVQINSGAGDQTTTGYSTINVTNLPAVTNLQVKITMRNNATSERWVIDDFKITGILSTEPYIILAPTTLTGFTYVQGSGPSAEQSFTVSGTNLSSNISIAPPTNYEISTGTGGSFSATNPIVLTQTGGNVSNTTIYVRLKAGLVVGTYNNEVITATSTGATNKTVTCSGSVTAPSPLITVTGALSSFGEQCINTPSAEQSYTVSGANLTNNITVTAPSQFQVSTTSGSGFGTSVTLTQSGGTVASTTIYARFLPTSTGSKSGNITHASSGATTRNQAVQGTGTSTPTVTTAVISNPLYTRTPLTSEANVGPAVTAVRTFI
jgi:hypothetical protein